MVDLVPRNTRLPARTRPRYEEVPDREDQSDEPVRRSRCRGSRSRRHRHVPSPPIGARTGNAQGLSGSGRGRAAEVEPSTTLTSGRGSFPFRDGYRGRRVSRTPAARRQDLCGAVRPRTSSLLRRGNGTKRTSCCFPGRWIEQTNTAPQGPQNEEGHCCSARQGNTPAIANNQIAAKAPEQLSRPEVREP